MKTSLSIFLQYDCAWSAFHVGVNRVNPVQYKHVRTEAYHMEGHYYH